MDYLRMAKSITKDLHDRIIRNIKSKNMYERCTNCGCILTDDEVYHLGDVCVDCHKKTSIVYCGKVDDETRR